MAAGNTTSLRMLMKNEGAPLCNGGHGRNSKADVKFRFVAILTIRVGNMLSYAHKCRCGAKEG